LPLSQISFLELFGTSFAIIIIIIIIMTTNPTPLVHYRFGCDAHGDPTILSDASFLETLVGTSTSTSTTTCQLANNAVTSTNIMESNQTIAALRDEFMATNATGLVLEVWMTPVADEAAEDASLSKPILTIGRGQTASSSDDDDSHDDDEIGIGCPGFELYMGQRGNLLEIRYSDNDPADSCRILLVRQQELVANQRLQVVLAINNEVDDNGTGTTTTNLYFNGIPIFVGMSNSVLTNLRTWNPDYTLQLFSNHHLVTSQQQQQHFQGSLHQVSLYNQAVNADQVADLYQRGLDEIETLKEERESLWLVAHSQANPAALVQGRAGSFRIGGYNVSTADYQILVEIVSLPQFGNLLSADGPISEPGQRIPLLGHEDSTSLMYRAWSDDFFTLPRLSSSGQDLNTHPEFFTYRIVAAASNNQNQTAAPLLGWSEPIQQELAIVHVNHPPSLVVPAHARITTTGIGIGAARPIALLEGVTLKDSDQNMDRVRVDLWAFHGTLTLSDEGLKLANFDCPATTTTTSNSVSWQCFGTGMANRNMTFVAEPDDVSSLLSHLQYNAFSWDQTDEIVVRIFDGAEGPCLSEEEHQRTTTFTTNDNFLLWEDTTTTNSNKGLLWHTIHEDCFMIETSIPVPGVPRPTDADASTLHGNNGKNFFYSLLDFKDFGITDAICWSVLAILLLCCCFGCQFCIKRMRVRGGNVSPENKVGRATTTRTTHDVGANVV
jgi:hypothetical protein